MPHEPARPPEDPDGYVVERPPSPRELSLPELSLPELSLPDVAERLMAEFGGRVDLATITRVVLDCRRDLQGAPPGALPELLERHARQHLLLLPAAATPTGAGVSLAGDPAAAATGRAGP
jgi:hypothetical protein